MPYPEDEEILNLLRNEVTLERGFRLLMQTYQEKMYWHIRRIVGSHDDADDVIQNTFIKAFKGFKGFEERSSLYTWLYRIATNEALSYQKSRKAKAIVSIDDHDHYLEEKSGEDFDTEKAVEKLNKALTELPEKQRIVFNLRYYDEMSYQDMSEILETSVGALKASYHHAVKKIEARLLA
ncbi:MAG: RNA polymerase sigma factor [Saprospiraceae bacterium]|nr:RNA polymerase sigma factor [Saprospiraceae bacterium]